MNNFLEVQKPCPVLNTPYFREIFGGKSGYRLQTDSKGHIRSLEFIALPGSFFKVLRASVPDCPRIYEVQSLYYSHSPLYIDRFFVKESPIQSFPQVIKNSFSKKILLKKMLAQLGTPYLWGGNYSCGIPEMMQLYKPSKKIASSEGKKWKLQGVDCSGLLYEATGGNTPRNTSDLLHFGAFLPIKGATISQIQSLVEPLDFIIYPGHIIFVVDTTKTIESKEGSGVVIGNLRSKLEELIQKIIPANSFTPSKNAFFIKRF